MYVRLPEGYGGLFRKMGRLSKSLYGLRQSPRMFNQLLMLELSVLVLERCDT